MKNIQDINYLTAIGVDMEDDQYVVYVQMLDFSNVTKPEGGSKPTQPITPWIGKAKGKNVITALNEMYKTSQQQLYFGQISALVCTEKAMKGGLEPIIDALDRYREFRYTSWVFGTKETMENIFAVQPFFNQSPLSSLLHEPQAPYFQESSIVPLQLRQFVKDFREPGKTSLIPSLTISKENWKTGFKEQPLLKIDGIYAFHSGTYKGWLGRKQLQGMRWMEPETKRSPLAIEMDGKPLVTLSIEKPKVNVTSLIADNKPTFHVDISVKATISQELENISQADIEQEAETKIKKEIIETYEVGLNNKTDILQLEHKFYRQKTKEWKKMIEDFPLTKESLNLNDIVVNVHITDSGRYKTIAE
ncbi:Ger(x)C family germination protein [Paenibacillus eucommiae]|uniref:Ger(X)C family germination protein n=1 Tax=Paenibacillus eucommiae TaxID=1355755 RepID=A0ABS4IQV8_9BACL|nr:Ger(x)C family germination protein [Paenibacillus eucommiae]